MKKIMLCLIVFVSVIAELFPATLLAANNPHTNGVFQEESPEILSTLLLNAKFSNYGKALVSWSGIVKTGKSAAENYPVLLSRIPSVGHGVPLEIKVFKNASELSSEKGNRALSHEEGYWLNVLPNKISLFSRSRAGVARGLVRLAALGARNGNKFPVGYWADWPSIRLRALHFVISNNVNYTEMKKLVDLASAAEFNTIIVLVTPNVGLSSFGKLSTSPRITQEQFIDFVRYAHESGLDVVPALKLLTHQEKLLGNNYPRLMFNRKTYDPRKEKVYKIVFPIIDQLIKITGAHKFLIGHDEVAGWGKMKPNALASLMQKEKPLPASLFLRDILKLNHHLDSLDVKTLMWGDMLLRPSWGTPRLEGLYMHGRLPGYGSDLWKSLPKSIIVCDWIYSGGAGNFGSALDLKKAGFRVIGATFKNANNISAYTRFAEKIGLHGMIATTWYYVQQHNWVKIQDIARRSGESFWNGGKE